MTVSPGIHDPFHILLMIMRERLLMLIPSRSLRFHEITPDAQESQSCNLLNSLLAHENLENNVCTYFFISFSGDVAQMVERSLSMREALGSMPSFSISFCGREPATFNVLAHKDK